MNPEPVTDQAHDTIAPIACPECGSADLEWSELVPAVREVVGIRAGRVVIRDHGQTLWQEGEQEHIECRACFHAFAPDAVNAPNGYDHDD